VLLRDTGMRSFALVICLSVLIAACAAQEASVYYDRLGSKVYSARNYTEALDYFNKSLAHNQSYAEAHVHAANTYRALGRLNASIEHYSMALQSDGNKVAAWTGLADVYSSQKDYVNASMAAGKATELEGKNKANWLREGNLLQLQGRFAEAAAKYDGALAKDPKYKDALYRKGLSELEANNTTRAIALFDQVLSLDPKYKQAYNAKGQALEAQGKYSGALAAYDRALQIDPKWQFALANKMNVLLIMGRQEEATDILIKL